MPSTLQELAGMQSLPESLPAAVRSPLERLGRELSYLHALLEIEQRAGEWSQVVTVAAPVLSAVARGALAEAAQAVTGVESRLVAWQALAKSLTIFYVGHAHMDMNWLWDWPETVDVVVNTLTTVDRLMDEFPDFRFSQSQTVIYDTVRRFAPDLFDRIGHRVRQGRWEITANQWVEGDKNLASDESIVRHLLYSKQFFSKHWGIAPDRVAIDFEPDTFGHPRGLPTIYRDAGVRWLYFCRGGPGDTCFRWQAPDGSEVIAWSDFQEWYLGTITGDEVGAALKFYAESKIPQFLKVYGVGDHGGGPTRKDLARLMEMRTWPIFPTLKPAFLADHFTGLETYRDQLPIFTGELNYVFPGCYSSESDTKTMNAQNEARLRTAEGLKAMASLLGVTVPVNHESLQTAWEGTLFSQFHDILSGSGIPETYRYTLGKGQDATAAAEVASQQAMAAISQAITSDGLAAGDDVLVVVFNPLAWDRSEVVEVEVYERFEPGTSLQLRDAEGQIVPVQFYYDSHLGFPGHRRACLTFPAKVPGLGYAVFIVSRGSAALPESVAESEVENLSQGHQVLRLAGKALSNLGLVSTPERWNQESLPREFRLFRQLGVSLYEQGFQVKTPMQTVQARAQESGVIWWRRSDNDQVATELGALQWFLEAPNGMSAWEIGPDLKREPVAGTRWTVTEVGPVRTVLTGENTVGASKVVASVYVYPDRQRIDWLLDVDWREFGSPQFGVPGLSLKFALPQLRQARARFGQSAGSVERPIPSRDVPAQGWTAVIGEEGAAVVYHPTRYGVSVDEDSIQVTLLRASYHPDPYAEVGRHQIPISFEWYAQAEPDQWTRTALERLSPLLGRVGSAEAGRLPTRSGTLALTSRAGVVTAVKPAENDAGIVVRLRHDDNVPTTLVLAVGDRVTAATRVSVLETATTDPIEQTQATITVPVKAHGLATIRLDE